MEAAEDYYHHLIYYRKRRNKLNQSKTAFNKMMGTEKDRENEKKMFVVELKYIITALILLFSIVTVIKFLSFSAADLRSYLSSTTVVKKAASQNSISPSLKDQVSKNVIIKRSFNPYGSAAYNFILMSAYRGGPNTFAVMGLASKPLHVYGKPIYQCQWVQNGGGAAGGGKIQEPLITTGQKILPDWGYGRVYTVLVVNCTFPSSTLLNRSSNGGKLLLHATTNGGGDTNLNITNTIEALTETEQDFKNFNEVFTSKPKYDYLYCGSSLYGNLSPQRLREWLAYHIRLLGTKSHFVIYDAGGVHEEVMAVLKPWIEKGYVTLQDIRDQERFDGYYHNQFLIVNDCLHRYKFMTKWMLFFDVDEFLYVPKNSNLKSVFTSFSDYTQFTIQQIPMSNRLCLAEDANNFTRKWGFEKLVFKDTKRGIRRDRKYAVQPVNVFATGVHLSQNIVGKISYETEEHIMYFHYHGTIAYRKELCRQTVNTSNITVDGTPYSLDDSMRNIGGFVKRFELNTIGPILQKTRQ